MTDPAAFDAFYRRSRERLLVQTYALTGDRSASRSAVRDAFVAAWHRRGATARVEDPEAAVRETAWATALRRHGARPWHRDKDVDQATRDTLEALSTLSPMQRRVLVLAHLATVSMPDLAREVGRSREETERELQSATAAFVLARGVPAAAVNAELEPLRSVVEGTTWPRATIVRRAGVARGRTHALVGLVAAVAVVVVSGLFVSDPTGQRPTLAQAVEGTSLGGDGGDDATPGSATAPAPADLLPRSAMLPAAQVARALPGGAWRAASTGDNSEGNGLVVPCQQERYLDPDGEAGLVREFRPAGAGGAGSGTRPSAVQLTEVSATPAAARRAYDTLADWVGGCEDARTQLVASRAVDGVGDQATQLVLRDWDAPVTTSVVQVARTGAVTTATATTYAGQGDPDAAALARLQAAAVDRACDLERAGPCARTPRLRDVAPPAVGPAPAMVSEIDLPPASGVSEPWIGTDPVPARTNAAATSCDKSSFTGAFQGSRWSRSTTRTFLVPAADLPTEFGLTETVGRLPGPAASAFVEQVRDRLSSCSDDLGTEVAKVAETRVPGGSLDAWQLTAEVTDQRSIRYFMAVLRQDGAVAQLGFVPAPGVTLPDGAFVDLARRALVRLEQLPGPAGGGKGGGNGGGGGGGGNGGGTGGGSAGQQP